jgi:hypothetical protein
MDPNVERFAKVERVIQDAVRYYREIYEEKNKLFKQSSACSSSRKTSHTSTQEHYPDMYCTVSLSKNKNITVFKIKNKR